MLKIDKEKHEAGNLLAWYFAPRDNRLRYGDGREITVGDIHTVKGKIVACSNGLHASINILDALVYAQYGFTHVYRVKLSGHMDQQADKIAASSRQYLEGYEVTQETLRLFARKQALKNIHLIAPYCSKKGYSLIVEYLETGQESIRAAARDATWGAASAAARADAWGASAAASAARAAASGAARADASAAASAARAAASAARAAASGAASAATWEQAGKELVELIVVAS